MFQVCKSYSDQSKCVNDFAEACRTLQVKTGHSDQDARAVALNNARSIARDTQMILNLLDSWAIGDEAVKQFIPQIFGLTTVTSDSVMQAGRMLQKNNKLSFLLLVQFQMENLFKNIHRGVLGTAPPSFYATVIRVLKFADLPESHVDTLTVAAKLRNSLHSNGVHQALKAATKEIITLGAVTYEFTDGAIVGNSDIEHITNAFDHTLSVVELVLNQPKIKSLPDPLFEHFVWEKETAPA